MESKTANFFAALAAIFAGLVTLLSCVGVAYVVVHFFDLWPAVQKMRMDPSMYWPYMIGIMAYGLIGFFLAVWVVGCIEDWVSFKLNQWLHKQAETLMPVLYECQNNGVSVLITAEQREQALRRMRIAGGNIMLVLDAMVFTADDHFYPMRLNNIRTGNWEDLRNLAEGCVVKPDSIHVNFSSFNMVDKVYQCANFRPPKFAEAKRWIQQEKARLARASWLRRNTFYAALVGFVLTILTFGAGMITTLAMTKTALFVASGASLATALWAVRRLNSL